jgi:hypothetical protein
MVEVELQEGGTQVVVTLSRMEQLGALHGNLTLPLAAITSVRLSPNPWSELKGIRCPGTGCPGLILLGTMRYSGGKDFVAVYRHRPALLLQLGPSARSQEGLLSAEGGGGGDTKSGNVNNSSSSGSGSAGSEWQRVILCTPDPAADAKRLSALVDGSSSYTPPAPQLAS